ncbi:hypothetical protein KFS98_003705 [Salmonella enterica]|nr:hypothetical protein [Salmonella enterica]
MVKPDLRDNLPTGGFRRGELEVIVATHRAQGITGFDMAKAEEQIMALTPKRIATIPATEDADCLYCKAVFKVTLEGSAGKHTTCPVCKAYHQYGPVINGEVTVTAMERQI